MTDEDRLRHHLNDCHFMLTFFYIEGKQRSYWKRELNRTLKQLEAEA